MTLTLSLGDLLLVVAVALLLWQVWTSPPPSPSPQDLRLRRQVDALMQHFGLPEPAVSRPGALSPPILALLAANRRVDAMRLYRQETGAGLKEAKEAIDRAGTMAAAGR